MKETTVMCLLLCFHMTCVCFIVMNSNHFYIYFYLLKLLILVCSQSVSTYDHSEAIMDSIIL